jgi:regulator of cell morphogenesis and NO signaling
MQAKKSFEKTSVGELVSENYVFAAVLHYFGISFYQYPSDSLEKVCHKHKVNPRQLIAQLESWALQKDPSLEELYLNPIELLVAYLKKKHYYFVRQELPFLSNLISGISPEPDYELLLGDLRILFPLFVEDFIYLAEHHEIHDDEMEGIRKLTNNYALAADAPLTMKVLYHELQTFEKELSIHAKIEDELLFPKAVELEKEALRKIRKQIQTN